jgi:hypothetical protein
MDLRPHLTNTSLQTHRGEDGVFLFDELLGCTVLTPQNAEGKIRFGEEDAANFLDQMCEILADTFRAAVEHPVHFQASPSYNHDSICLIVSAASTQRFRTFRRRLPGHNKARHRIAIVRQGVGICGQLA